MGDWAFFLWFYGCGVCFQFLVHQRMCYIFFGICYKKGMCMTVCEIPDVKDSIRQYKLQTVSVVVPLYNKKEYILECIESIQKQTWNKLEIIVVNDGSTDSSEKIVMEVSDDPRIQMYSIKHSGPAKARNVGIEHASGEFITFVDADDFIKPTYIQRMVSAIDDADVCVAGFKVWYQKKDLWKLYRSTSMEYLKDDFLRNYLKYSHLVSGVGWKLYRTELVCKNGCRFPEDLRYGEDFFFFNQMLRFVKKLSMIEDMSYIYRHHDLNSESCIYGINIEARELYYNKILELYDVFVEKEVKTFLLSKEIVLLGWLGICMCRMTNKFSEKRAKFRELAKKCHVSKQGCMKIPWFKSKLTFISIFCIYTNSFLPFYLVEKLWRLSYKGT